MEAKHTQGPWRVFGYDIGTSPDETLAVVCAMDDNTDDANACLIAAAPELLAACQAVLDEFPAMDGRRIESVKAICRAAIAKAKGG
jgi:hypothetical protein